MNFQIFCVLFGLASLGLTYFLIKKLIPLLQKKQVHDVPNDRSLHTEPVPRGAGLAVMVPIGLMLLLLFILGGDDFGWVFLGAALLVAVSWLDDLKSLSPIKRLGCHFLAVIFVVFQWPEGQRILPDIVPLWLDRSLLVLAWVWFINLSNFMDGIDGLTGVHTLTVAIGFLIISMLDYTMYDNQLLACVIAGAMPAFLKFNWHPAKIFMGDVGSVPLGFICGWLLIDIALGGELLAALIIPLYYLVDSGWTLGCRLKRRKKVWLAHREHAYQKAALAMGSHAPVARMIGLYNIGFIAIAAATVALSPWCAVVAVALVAHLMLTLKNMKPA